MALPIINGVVRAAVVGQTHGGDTWTNVQHWRFNNGAGVPSTANIDALHPILVRLYTGTAYGAGISWLSLCSTSTTIQRVDYTVLDGSAMGYTRTIAGAGLNGASTLPAEVAAVLSLRTNTRGRRWRGRMYLPAPANSVSAIGSDGHLQASVVTQTIAQAEGVKSAALAVQWAPVVASYGKSLVKDPNDKYDKIEVTWSPFATDVASYTMDQVLDVQRRRKS